MKYIAIGHVCQDIVADGKVLGGAATYTAVTAAALGCRVSVITRTRSDLDLPANGIDWIRLPSEYTTTFENVYTREGRVQTLHQRAEAIAASDVRAQRIAADVVHLAPIANEVDPALIDAFDQEFIGVTPQGWMRQWDAHGRVTMREWQGADAILRRADAIVFSVVDVAGDWSLIERWASMARILVVTQGRAGCTAYVEGKRQHAPVSFVEEVDPTGAGDIFATAFFVHLRRSHDPIQSAHYANCIASRSVSRCGLQGAPTADEVRHCASALEHSALEG
jgi:sugar/nucleoside kinase (ribokinase family)